MKNKVKKAKTISFGICLYNCYYKKIANKILSLFFVTSKHLRVRELYSIVF